MVNILGDAWKWDGDSLLREPDWAQLLAESKAKLHLYGKSEPRRARKMGHFTVTGRTMRKTLELARNLKASLND
jgi:5-(carboxyamino)imidazole ribonucleotide synthase